MHPNVEVFHKTHLKNGNPRLSHELLEDYMSLSENLKNLLRNIIFNNINSHKSMQRIRKVANAKELAKINRILLSCLKDDQRLIPLAFPKTPNIEPNYIRFDILPVTHQLSLINNLIYENISIISFFVSELEKLNKSIIREDYLGSDNLIKSIIDKCGYSHFIIRKIMLLNELASQDINLPFTEEFLISNNSNGQNSIISSLQECYQPEIDFLSMKKSIMGNFNNCNYYSHLMQIPFFYRNTKHIKNNLEEKLYSNFQSSLIDSIVFIKTNREHFDLHRFKNIEKIIKIMDSTNFEEVFTFYNQKYANMPGYVEIIFNKHASAWYENESVNEYRLLNDYFYDDPNALYIDFNDSVNIRKIKTIIEDYSLMDLLLPEKKIPYELSKLQRLIKNNGEILTASIFNYKFYITKGFIDLEEDDLVYMMGVTSDLQRTSNFKFLKNAADRTDSMLSKIILYLLISKLTPNEKLTYRLQKYVEHWAVEAFEGNLISMLETISEKSFTVARFFYETFNEDFLIFLNFVNESVQMATNIRANMHFWMYEKTQEKMYYERARNMLIDYQINKVRNEIDDNRIYVDSTKFLEWITDNTLRDFTSILTVITSNQLTHYESPHLMECIEKSYEEFCSNKVFGISSYLGRRIRHGTFKGHIYSNVITNLEERYTELLEDKNILARWDNWKLRFEQLINRIISENLHIETSQMPNGLIKPYIKGDATKQEIANNYVKHLINDYVLTTTINLAGLVEICWRLITVDLLKVNIFLKEKKTEILEDFKVNFIRFLTPTERHSKEILVSFQYIVDEKFTLFYDWFKQPQNMMPKANISLLFQAIIREAKESYPAAEFEYNDNSMNYELIGGAYHVVYDALFVIIMNAVKHGKPDALIICEVNLIDKKIFMSVTNDVKENQSDEELNKSINIANIDNIDDAQLYENKSGIKKLYNLQKYNENFTVERNQCLNRKVVASISYKVAYNV